MNLASKPININAKFCSPLSVTLIECHWLPLVANVQTAQHGFMKTCRSFGWQRNLSGQAHTRPGCHCTVPELYCAPCWFMFVLNVSGTITLASSYPCFNFFILFIQSAARVTDSQHPILSDSEPFSSFSSSPQSAVVRWTTCMKVVTSFNTQNCEGCSDATHTHVARNGLAKSRHDADLDPIARYSN